MFDPRFRSDIRESILDLFSEIGLLFAWSGVASASMSVPGSMKARGNMPDLPLELVPHQHQWSWYDPVFDLLLEDGDEVIANVKV